MGIDKRLVEHWRRQQSVRRKARAAASADPPPAPPRLTVAPDESVPAESGSNVVPMELEDR